MTNCENKDLQAAPAPLSGARRLGHPLEFLCECHAREREVCALIDRIAVAHRPDREIIRRVRVFLEDELPPHIEDEEQDLFPLLRRRCGPADQIDAVIARLTRDHVHVGGGSSGILDILLRWESGGGPLSDEDRAALIGYASETRHHLILENAVVLPFARLRLTDRDLESLRIRMLQRRGLRPDSEVRNAG